MGPAGTSNIIILGISNDCTNALMSLNPFTFFPLASVFKLSDCFTFLSKPATLNPWSAIFKTKLHPIVPRPIIP